MADVIVLLIASSFLFLFICIMALAGLELAFKYVRALIDD